MDQLREKRYRDKINYIVESLEDLKEEPDNSLEKKGILYCIQTIIESLVDLISMLIKDIGIPVKADKKNINTLVKERNLDPTLAEKLIKANGMRNIIVHRYNGIEEKIILGSIDKIKDLTELWLEEIEVILDEIKNNEKN